ncbi:hypothetical protein [Pararhodonellum marinum]|uniref:hypothetical protein n=1 Tax=Pararhodonellum marinum TaxID=2755358 RepID=UPI00188E0F45|nr:hypothetical protein [Pararhodonellum marinum]
MKKLLFTITTLLIVQTGFAQETTGIFQRYTYGEFRIGYGQTIFGNGLVEKFDELQMGPSGGILASIGAYRALNPTLHLGLRFKALAASPSTNNAGDEMFFNYWATSIASKIFPFPKGKLNGFFIQPELAFSTQFTQKYRNISNSTYDHQFAIGTGFTLAAGYEIPLKNGWNSIMLTTELDWASRNGETTGIGEVNFTNANLGFMVGIKF